LSEEPNPLKPVVEALLMVAEEPLSLDRIARLVGEGDGLPRDEVRGVVADLQLDYSGKGVELVEVASGYKFRARAEFAPQVGRLWDERKPRYSRALLETLAIIAYRQPITRGEIEHIRGVAVSSNIIRQMLDRNWIKVVGHRDVPGRPAVFATTREFLDYFGLKTLAELPSLAELKDFDNLNVDLFGAHGESPVLTMENSENAAPPDMEKAVAEAQTQSTKADNEPPAAVDEIADAGRS
jgi:segregation and condensation protein B